MSFLKKKDGPEKQINPKKDQAEDISLEKLEKVSGGGLRDVEKVDPTDIDDDTKSKA